MLRFAVIANTETIGARNEEVLEAKKIKQSISFTKEVGFLLEN